MRTLIYAALFCAFLSIIASAQTRVPSSTPQNRPTANATRTIPVIKCVDHNTAAACRSFKQLVDARDERLLNDVLGQPGHNKRHISYVCLRPQEDTFNVIEFDIPQPQEYRQPYTQLNELLGNKSVSDLREMSKQMMEHAEFMDSSVSLYTMDQWFQDHSKESVYAQGYVGVSRYQDGLYIGPADEIGEWSRPASDPRVFQQDPPAWFTGAYAWIEGFNSQHDNVSAEDDNPKHAHITVDPYSIHIHYKYENPAGDLVDYAMQINRSTGRFIEYFKFPYDHNEVSGTCMIFK